MPIEIHPDDDTDPIDVRPNTNEAAVLAVLAKHPRKAFTQTELADRAEVSQGSIYKTVERLIDKGLVQQYADGEHVHVVHDRRDAIYRRLRSFRDVQTFARLFDEDYFSENPDWADEFDDLGREPLPERDSDPRDTTSTDEDFDVSEMSDLDTE